MLITMRSIFKPLMLTSNIRIILPVFMSFRNCTYHQWPIFDFYHRTTGKQIPEKDVPLLKKKHPNIDKVDQQRLQCSLQILQKFGITPLEACHNLHVFSMNPITVDNYGEILKECGFINIMPKHIIKYHTIAKHSTIASLKKQGTIRDDVELEESLLDYFREWPAESKTLIGFPESTSCILTVRTSVLERYLKWRLSITTEEFDKYCRNYLPLRHKPMCDIKEALDLAENEIQFNMKTIRRNGFIVAADPTNTKLTLENVNTIAGMDIREAIRLEPAILKNNYNALVEIRSLLEEFRIPEEFQRRCLRVYCMRPDTVRERLDELTNMKEYKVLSTNPRVLTLVIHKNKMMKRINKIQIAKKQCYSLNHLISASKVFNNYISSFGSKVCGRDIGILIDSSLNINESNGETAYKTILKQLRKHKYWLHISLNTVDENIQFLKRYFDDAVIFNNTQLLLYPLAEIDHYVEIFLKMRRKEKLHNQTDTIYHNLNHEAFTDDQILSLVLYEIEKKYHFSGDGIWARIEVSKTENVSAN